MVNSMFDVYFLNFVHRQGDDKAYAELLKRVSVQEYTDEDFNKLLSRQKKSDDPNLSKDSLRLMLINERVNSWNAERLNVLPGNAVTNTVLMTRDNSRNGSIRTDNAGMVLGTQLPASLTLKVGAKIVMTMWWGAGTQI